MDKSGGKLTGVLDLGVGVYEPDASWVQRALASNMLKGCSIGFYPTRWDHSEARAMRS